MERSKHKGEKNRGQTRVCPRWVTPLAPLCPGVQARTTEFQRFREREHRTCRSSPLPCFLKRYCTNARCALRCNKKKNRKLCADRIAYGRLRHSLHPVRVVSHCVYDPRKCKNHNRRPDSAGPAQKDWASLLPSNRVPYRTKVLSGRLIISDVVKRFEGGESKNEGFVAQKNSPCLEWLRGRGFAVPSRRMYRGRTGRDGTASGVVGLPLKSD